MAPVPRVSKANKRVLALKCKWRDCGKTFALPADGYHAFAEHVSEHLSSYLKSLSQFGKENSTESDDVELMVPMKCEWFECPWETRGNFGEFSRHVMFHAYHSRLKCLGAFAVIAEKLRQCSFDVETQDLLPDLSEPFLCKWESCGVEFYCPDKFYRHVDMHGHGAHREDVLVTTGEKATTDYNGSSDKQVEGLAVHTMMQSVCKWEGCSYLAKDPWKVKEHCRIHTGERKIACPSCGMFFANKTKLADHLIRQDAKQYENFQCSHCLKRCASERLLRDHMRHHVNHVKCQHCDMTCPNPSALRSHLKFKHSLDRPFQCAMCDFSCKTRHDLQRHEEIHFDKRFQCEVEGCIYEGKTVAGLRAHVKAMHERHGSRQFMCHICKKSLSRGYLLTKHLKKDHHFSWPAGHSRFRYKLDEDGYYRLQMVRFESAELTEQLSQENPEANELCDDIESQETMTNDDPSNQGSETLAIASTEDLRKESPVSPFSFGNQDSPTHRLNTNPDQASGAVSVSLNDGYEALLRFYEMAKDDENSGPDMDSSPVSNEDRDEGPSMALKDVVADILQAVPEQNNMHNDFKSVKRKHPSMKKAKSKRLKSNELT